MFGRKKSNFNNVSLNRISLFIHMKNSAVFWDQKRSVFSLSVVDNTFSQYTGRIIRCPGPFVMHKKKRDL